MSKGYKIAFGFIAALILSMSLFFGIKTYKIAKGMKVYGKCYFVTQVLMSFKVVGYKMERYSFDGVYTIEGVLIAFPFKTTVPQSELENEILPLAEEISCEGE